jgi:hypothetical protein
LVFVLGSAAVFIGLLGLVHQPWERWFALAELLLLCSAIGFNWIGQRQSHHMRWIQSRELSEQFRAYWGLVLTGQGRWRARGQETSWNDWLFNAYAAADGLTELTATPDEMAKIADAIRVGVVEDQIAYHERNRRTLRQIHRSLEQYGRTLLLAAISCCALLVAMSWFHGALAGLVASPNYAPSWTALLRLLENLLKVGCAALPAMGAAVAGVRYQGDFLRFSQRSRQTHRALGRVRAGLYEFAAECRRAKGAAQTPLYETLQALIADLEQVLLSDLFDWRFVYRARSTPEPA